MHVSVSISKQVKPRVRVGHTYDSDDVSFAVLRIGDVLRIGSDWYVVEHRELSAAVDDSENIITLSLSLGLVECAPAEEVAG